MERDAKPRCPRKRERLPSRRFTLATRRIRAVWNVTRCPQKRDFHQDASLWLDGEFAQYGT
eukprot:6917060-Prymnesium_polylepis.1